MKLPDLEIDHVEYPELQKGIRPDVDAKSVRLDVYVRDGKGTVYDIEMQVSDTKELPKRTRYYHYPNHYKIQTFSLNAIL